jgi:hypothetical protein
MRASSQIIILLALIPGVLLPSFRVSAQPLVAASRVSESTSSSTAICFLAIQQSRFTSERRLTLTQEFSDRRFYVMGRHFEPARFVVNENASGLRMKRDDAVSRSIIGDPDSKTLPSKEREVIAARYFASQHLPSSISYYTQVALGKSAFRLLYGLVDRHAPRTELCPDVVAKNRQGLWSFAEAKGSDVSHGIHQLIQAIDQVGGLAQIDELALIITNPSQSVIDERGFIAKEGGVFGLSYVNGELRGSIGDPDERSDQFRPIRFILVADTLSGP